jgi:hypothetical protein
MRHIIPAKGVFVNSQHHALRLSAVRNLSQLILKGLRTYYVRHTANPKHFSSSSHTQGQLQVTMPKAYARCMLAEMMFPLERIGIFPLTPLLSTLLTIITTTIIIIVL